MGRQSTIFFVWLSSLLYFISLSANKQFLLYADHTWTVDFFNEHRDLTLDASRFFMDGVPYTPEVSQGLDLQKLLFYELKRLDLVSITAELHDLPTGKTADFFLTRNWVCGKISCTGILTNRDRYKRLYGLEKNELFTKELHEHGLDAIRQNLYQQGYRNAQVTAQCIHHEVDHTVDSCITIKRGTCYRIASVCAQSAVESDDSEIEAIIKKIEHLGTKYLLGAYCTQEAIDKRLERLREYLLKKGYLYPVIEVVLVEDHLQGTVDLTFRCTLKHQRDILFSGNRFFSSAQLYELVQDFGKALSVIPGSIVVDELLERYHQEGFFDCTISAVSTTSGLHFFINEGTRAAVGDVQFMGAQEFMEPYRKKLLTSKRYDKAFFNKTVRECLEQALKNGYWNARMTDLSWHKIDGSSAYSIQVTFDLGLQRNAYRCTATGFQHLLDKVLSQPWCRISGPLDPFLIARMRKFLQKELQKAGHLYVKVSCDIEAAPDGVATLVWKFDGAAEPVHFGPTIIKGLRTVPEHIIRREMYYKRGDVWNGRARDDTVVALRNLGIFDSVTLFPDDITQQEDEKLMMLQVRESDPFELKARAGFQGVGTNLTWQGGATYKFGGTFSWKNPLHCADILSVQADVTRFMRNFTLMYQLPWLWKLPVRNQYKAYSIRYDQPIVIGSRDILYRFSQDGFLWALAQLYSFWQWGLTSGIEWLRVGDLSETRARAIDFSTQFIQRRIPYAFSEFSLFINNVDNRLDPMSGHSTLASCKAQVPFTVGCGSTVKFFVEQSGYIPFSRWHHIVLALRLRLGFIAYQQFNRIMPPERFYLGGAYSLRGYQPDLAPPINIYHDSDGQLRYVPTGGKSMVNSNIELRFPIYRALSGALFCDLGVLTQKALTAVRGGDIMAALGWGVRWNTPLGPLRFDIGWRLRELPEQCGFPCQPAYVWFLTLGNAF